MRRLVLVLLLSICVFSSVEAVVLYSRMFPAGNYRVFLVASESMEPTIMKGNLILVDQSVNVSDIYAAPYPNGTIIVFHQLYGDETIVHRAIEKRTTSVRVYYVTKGDHNQAPDPGPIPAENVIGKVVDNNYPFYAITMGFFLSLSVAVATGISSLAYYLINRNRDHTRQLTEAQA